MEQITDLDPNSNSYFFITGIADNTFKAGNNSFIINATDLVLVGPPLSVSVYDPNGNALSVDILPETGPNGIPLAELRQVYIVNIPADTEVGIGKIQINGVGIDPGLYTGSIAFFNGQAYPVSNTQRLPLNQPPQGVAALPQAQITWTRNILIDTLSKTDSEVRFFDLPYVEATPQIYNTPSYPVGSYTMASGSCSTIAVVPRNNASGDFSITQNSPIYQLFFSAGNQFVSSMEGEDIRIKTPYVKNFTYANYSNSQVTYSGILNTDFIAKIIRVVNSTTLLLDIPFSTVSNLIGRINQDSPYSKSNLVDIHGYNPNDSPANQTVFLKNNFYILSIGKADYEIIYKSIPTVVGSSGTLKSLLNLEANNLRTHCGNISAYKVYGNSLNSPETKTYLCGGKVVGEENIASNNFNNGFHNLPGNFYDQIHTSRFWLTTSPAITFVQTSVGLIDGVQIGHAANTNQADYVIFKDDTTGGSRTSQYISYNFSGNASYWYAKSDAFLDAAAQPSTSYTNIANIPLLSAYVGSQENLLNGAAYDSNPIKLRKSTLYSFSMLVVPFNSNTQSSQLYVYFVSGQSKKQIGIINAGFKSITDELYQATFFSDIEQYGTIILVPVSGNWYISSLSLTPYQAMDYSVDSFAIKIPFNNVVKNELFEIEIELYDEAGRLAYGEGAYTFKYNKIFSPLKKQFFIDPAGIL
jgi:hypothetical protein